ncbi:MAG TPA: ATP-binding protein [Acidimicrobiales bacterium]|nr:ATP-binding protein [Acidimicrobiales bacterium]
MDVRTSTRLRRDPAAVPAARAFVDHALRSAGVAPDVADSLVQAAAEACNNAILHAAGATFTVSVNVAAGVCTLAVSDLGLGFDPPEHARMPSPQAVDHRGLALMEALVDHVKVSSTPAGTTVVLVHNAPVASPAGRQTRVVVDR